MSIEKKLQQRTLRRKLRTRAALRQQPYPRVCVYRSLSNIYVQLIDDQQQRTLASYNTLQLQATGNKKDRSYAVGLELAQRALALGVTQVKFDRGSYLYHGRVKAVAEGLRAGGLTV